VRIPRPAILSLVALAACGLGAQRASAQVSALDCGTSSDTVDQLFVLPRDGDNNVALNAPISVRYAQGVDLDALQASLPQASDDPCQRQLVCLFYDARNSGGAAREPVSGSVMRVNARTVAFVPSTALRAHTHYFPLITRAGFELVSRTELEFVTGAHADHDPPVFDPAPASMRLSVEAPPAECHAPLGSLRVALTVPRATDDGDESSIEISLFVTRAANQSGTVLRARARNPAPDGGPLQLSFLLDRTQARAPVCLALRATDGVGRLSKGEPKLCFDPVQGSFFAPCSIGRALGAPRALAKDGARPFLIAFWPVAAAALTARRRGRHARSRSRLHPEDDETLP
jgi:hypothetical protein